jgi:hypothetical protein
MTNSVARIEQLGICSVWLRRDLLRHTPVLSRNLLYKIRSTSSTAAFVSAARPALAVIPVGQDSPHGHPHPAVVGRWRAAGAQVFTTGERGTVTVSTDGEDLRVETFVRP